jgi:hypothetical protein
MSRFPRQVTFPLALRAIDCSSFGLTPDRAEGVVVHRALEARRGRGGTHQPLSGLLVPHQFRSVDHRAQQAQWPRRGVRERIHDGVLGVEVVATSVIARAKARIRRAGAAPEPWAADLKV